MPNRMIGERSATVSDEVWDAFRGAIEKADQWLAH
jgi:hypothetical protein